MLPTIITGLVLLSATPEASMSSSTGAAHLSGAEAVREIDWTSVTSLSPIPNLMPSRSSDDPVEAGFAPQWAERALADSFAVPSTFRLQRTVPPVLAMPLALKIMSQNGNPQDHWAYAVERHLRKVIRSTIEPEHATISRVFCNALGCLCYLERDHNEVGVIIPSILEPLISRDGWAQELGIDPRDAYRLPIGTSNKFWMLIYILHSNDRGVSAGDKKQTKG
jgi:hypothetical protein